MLTNASAKHDEDESRSGGHNKSDRDGGGKIDHYAAAAPFQVVCAITKRAPAVTEARPESECTLFLFP